MPIENTSAKPTVTEVIDIEPLLQKLHAQVNAILHRRQIGEFRIVGIRNGGIWVAEELAKRLQHRHALGELDISFHRDDFSKRGLDPQVCPSDLPYAIDGVHLLLVDDVLFTGRTIRAAMNELHDWGRPASITLAVLASRPGRELPIQADACGAEISLSPDDVLQLRGPAPLQLQRIAQTQD